MLAGQWSIESTGIKFDCSQGTLLRVASYSLFALFGAAALNELALTVLGLRGEQQGCIWPWLACHLDSHQVTACLLEQARDLPQFASGAGRHRPFDPLAWLLPACHVPCPALQGGPLRRASGGS